MATFNQLGLDLKIFVREGDKEYIERKEKQNYPPKKPLSGYEARTFYESLVTEHKANVDEKKSVSKRCLRQRQQKAKQQSRVKSQSINPNEIFKFAQNNDVSKLQQLLLQKELNINSTDAFGWTPLMCAVCSGATEAVVHLLNHGANPNITNKLGLNAINLAVKNKNKDLFELIQKWSNKNTSNIAERASCTKSYHCETCNQNFHDVCKEEHEHSTLHLFNYKSQVPPQTFYGIPESNRGYQLMLKTGWDKEQGLGPDGLGKKFPIKTKQKTDKIGLGATKLKSNHHSKPAKQSRNHTNKKERSLNQARKNMIEKNFRLQFS